VERSLAQSLFHKAEEVALDHSEHSGERGYKDVTWDVQRVIPLSEKSGGVIFKKSDGKKALGYFWWGKNRDNKWVWRWMFPSVDQLFGMGKLQELHYEVEQENYQVSLEPSF